MAKPRKTGKAKEVEKKTRRHGLFPQAKEESSKKGVQRTKSKPKRELLGKRYTIYK